MPLCAAFGQSISTFTATKSRAIITSRSETRNVRFFSCSAVAISNDKKSKVIHDSLRVLQWDKLCDSVSSFARTSLGRQATQWQLWSVDQTYEDSLRLLDETNAAIEMQKHGGCSLDLTGIDLLMVKSAIRNVRRGLSLRANEALAVVALLQFSETLQLNLKAAIKEDADWYSRFMPLSQMITKLVVDRSLIKLILQIVDEDGSVKDSASPVLKQSREQVRLLERKLFQLMDRLIRNENSESSLLEMSNIDGRWCIKSGADQLSFNGLLLSSGSGIGSIVEPLSAVPINDELQQARALATKAEEDVLLTLTKKMQVGLDDIEKILNSVIQLDVINARATYSLSFGGTCPCIFLPEDQEGSLTHGALTSKVSSPKREWTLYLPNAYHPLLLQQHKQNLQKARKDLKNATAERRRKLQGQSMRLKHETDINLSSLEMQVAALELAHPVPVNVFIARKTKVLIITGPNTGGKTISLKTVGLAAMMAKSGLHVLSSESAQIPWFDSVFADIGDEQSLSQSLSTFSGHLKQISDIRSQSTSQSLVLLDEVGAGTNPLEGAALGMSLLEAFAENGALLTIATTHHGELKTLKYSDDAFENACMEFDEVNLRPTYKILWGVPGRSNAINIAERLGLPSIVVQNARQLYGAASAEINEVIIDMERFKQEFQDLLPEARCHLMLSRNLHASLLLTRRKIMEHGNTQRYLKMREIAEAAAVAHSLVRKSARQLRAYAAQPLQRTEVGQSQHSSASNSQHTTAEDGEHPMILSSSAVEVIKQPATVREPELPEVGDLVHVSSLSKKGTVLRVEPSKEEIVVQVGNMKLKVKLMDVQT
ncbi:putative DNA mismatch repair protein MutS [Melia azedarach]|uniref:DNA mismatch repair protein MutS n=1 Tax=Melia azedarach TaxID=155640 RepID=A0ACC1YUF4_MELAZ|nr:putative DNA mismatch repair protein MutS [Melia azedarach]